LLPRNCTPLAHGIADQTVPDPKMITFNQGTKVSAVSLAEDNLELLMLVASRVTLKGVEDGKVGAAKLRTYATTSLTDKMTQITVRGL